MIYGVGTDLLKMSRILDSSLQQEDPFLQKVFTEKERQQASGRSDSHSYYCTRFAGKEAVFKALRTDPDRCAFREIEILDDADGAPGCSLSGEMQKSAAEKGIVRMHVSLSWENEYALAFAAAETD